MGLEKVVWEKNHDAHITPERTAVTFFTDQNDTFGLIPRQVRILSVNTGNISLGNHWRDYKEIYGITGQATFKLEDIESKDRRAYDLKTGDRLFVPPKIALQVLASRGTIIYVASEETDREKYTHKYELAD